MTNIICGVDVSGQTLDACIERNGARTQVVRTPEGIGQLAAFCRQHDVALVVMEATGGYERLPFSQLWGEGLAVALVNPRAVRRFAEAMGRLEKTDRIDCAMIAAYARTRQVEPTPPPPPTQQRLTALVLRLRQLTDLRTAQKNQRRLVTEPEVLATFTTVIAMLTQQIRQLETSVAALIETDPLWVALDAAFRETKGVSERTVARLMAQMPEIGTCSGKAASKLGGLAPIARDSGKKTGRRRVRGGREGVRSILYCVSRGVAQHDADFKAFAARLQRAGKPPKVIRTTLAHKLLVRLNAKARDVRQALAAASMAGQQAA